MIKLLMLILILNFNLQRLVWAQSQPQSQLQSQTITQINTNAENILQKKSQLPLINNQVKKKVENKITAKPVKKLIPNSASKTEKKSEFKLPLHFDYSIDLQGGLENRLFVTEPQPLLKEQYGLATNAFVTSVFADLKWKNQNFQIVVRPMFLGLLQENKYVDHQSKIVKESKIKTDFKELFAVWMPNGDSSVGVGRQKYEWGPTEFYNVSNPFVIKSQQDSFVRTFTISPLILKLSQSFFKSWNLTFVFNLENSSELRSGNKEIIDKAYVVKLENASTTGQFIFGSTYGKGNITPPFIGLYGRWSHISGVSLYTDTKQSLGSAAYYPFNGGSDLSPVVTLQDTNFNTSKTFYMSILGIRWENKWDFRYEYLYNGIGYDKHEKDIFPLAFIASNPYAPTNANIIGQLHMPFFQKNYNYLSARSPQFGPQKKYVFNFNFVENNDDHSFLTHLKLEREIGDSGTLIIATTLFGGDQLTGEYSNYVNNYYSCIFKWIL